MPSVPTLPESLRTAGTRTPGRRLLPTVVFIAAGLLTSCAGSHTSGAPATPELPGPDEYSPFLDADEVASDQPTVTSLVDAYEWEVLSSGAGGFVTGMSVDRSGDTMLARTDVGGAYQWDPVSRTWEQLVRADNVERPQRGDYYVASAVVAPSDPSRLYLAAGNTLSRPTGRLLRSDDGGATWIEVAGGLAIDGNAPYRNGAERLAVDPTDPDEVWFATNTQGLLVSRDGGVGFTPVEGVPITPAQSEEGIGTSFVIADDDGVTIWVGVAYVGVFVSSDDGTTWNQLYETEGIPIDAGLDRRGRLWVVEDRPGAIRIIDDDEVVDVTAPAGRLRVLGLDPFDPDTALVGAPGIAGGSLWRTTDSGTSWTSIETRTSCPSVPWLDDYASDFLPTGSLLFHPVDGSLWIPEGFGIWHVDDPSRAQLDLRCEVAGVEQLVTNDIIIPRGGHPVTAHWDRAIFHHGSTSAQDAIVGPTDRFNSAWDLDWSEADPQVVFAVVADHRFCCEDDGEAYASGWSDDGGRTWTRFGSYASGHPTGLRFGNIAVSASNVDNLVWLPSFDGAPHVTFNRGETWREVTLPSTGDTGSGSHFAYYLNRKVLAADRIEPSTFYLYHGVLGVFRSLDGGASWELQASDGLPVGWTVGYYNATLAASPMASGHLVFAPGELVEEVTGLYESFDAGASWSRRSGITGVTALGWGAAPPGRSAPTLYVAGTVDGTYGVWRSIGADDQWDLISSAPGGNYQLIKALAADVEEFGTIYVGFEGTSTAMGRLRSNP